MEEQEQGHRWFAAFYERISSSSKPLFDKVGPRLMGETGGRVLEVGVGTGATFAYYPAGVSLVGVEPDPHMLKRARAKLATNGATNIELQQQSAESLPFDDASFDHVVFSLVLCTVRDQPRALAEAKRVLKPGGTLRVLEHVRNDRSSFWGTTQDVIAPVWRWCAAGCNPNRRTREAIEAVGFRFDWMEWTSVGPGTPAIYGVARAG